MSHAHRMAPPLGMAWIDWAVAILVLGYLTFTRTFAYLGVAPIYIGEAALAAFLIARAQPIVRPLLGSQIQASPISGWTWWLFLFLGYGLVELMRGVAAGHDKMVALQNFVFHAYPLFFFAGVWVGRTHRKLLANTIWWLAWLNGLYGIIYVAFVYPGEDTVVGAGISWFGQPRGATVVILGLLCFVRDWRKTWLPLLLNAFVLVGMQGRSEWISLAVCLPLWGLLAGRLSHVFKLAMLGVTALLLFLVVDVPLPMKNNEGQQMSTHKVVGFALSAVDEDAAKDLYTRASSDASTVTWRTRWWSSLWLMVHDTPARALFGPGYGFPIWEYHEEQLDDFKLRTPHNAFMYALSYTGWIGVLLFYGLQFCLALLLWRVYRLTGQAFGICFWVLMMTRSMFDPFFETPYLAIPYWLIMGLAVAPLLPSLRDKRQRDGGFRRRDEQKDN